MRRRHRAGLIALALSAAIVVALAVLPGAWNFVVLRHGTALSPPPPRFVELGGGCTRAAIRRLTREDEIDVFLVEGLFGVDELQELVGIAEARQGFQPSMQKLATGEQLVDGRRTSSSCPMLWPLLVPAPQHLEQMRRAGQLPPGFEEELAATTALTERCARLLEVDAACIEPLQLVKYTAGQYYQPHLDSHDEPHRRSSYAGEQRTHTLLVFVSDVPPEDGGGHLHFPRLGLRVLPRAGAAVLWRNARPGDAAGEWCPDPDSLHEGVAPVGCSKIAMNVWVADRPFDAEAVRLGHARGSHSRAPAAAPPAETPAAGPPAAGPPATDWLD